MDWFKIHIITLQILEHIYDGYYLANLVTDANLQKMNFNLNTYNTSEMIKSMKNSKKLSFSNRVLKNDGGNVII